MVIWATGPPMLIKPNIRKYRNTSRQVGIFPSSSAASLRVSSSIPSITKWLAAGRALTNNTRPELFDWREPLAAVLVEGVVHDELFFQDLVIVPQPQGPEALGDCFQSGR